MLTRLAQMGQPSKAPTRAYITQDENMTPGNEMNFDPPRSASAMALGATNASDASGNDYRFSVGKLPAWAKKQVETASPPPQQVQKGVDFPKGQSVTSNNLSFLD